jgi:GcrA cell cycle regulator
MWHHDGLSISQCAKRLGVKRGAISGKLSRLGAIKRGVNGSVASNITSSSRQRKMYRTGKLPLSFGRGRSRRDKMALRIEDLTSNRFVDIEVTADDPAPHERVKLVDITRSQCHWPMGDPLKEDFAYCGRKRGAHRSYCDHHAERAVRGRFDPTGDPDDYVTYRSACRRNSVAKGEAR